MNSWPNNLILACHFGQGIPRRSLYERCKNPESCGRALRAHNFLDYRIFRKDFSWEFPDQNGRQGLDFLANCSSRSIHAMKYHIFIHLGLEGQKKTFRAPPSQWSHCESLFEPFWVPFRQNLTNVRFQTMGCFFYP